jgi:predicted MPP superfamily phosphohydrolase
MKRIFLALSVCLFALNSFSQVLKFRPNGEFKIVQFTDIHYNGSKQSQTALSVVDSVLQNERPDLVVLTGDIVWGKPGKENLLAVLNRISGYNVPFVYQFGNHDSEMTDISNRDLYNLARTVKNNILPDVSDSNSLDYILPVRSHDNASTAAVIYCLDSNSYPVGISKDRNPGTYAWLTFDQVQWYRQQSHNLALENGGNPYPALAFFHIPVPEFHDAVRAEDAILIGTRREAVCSPAFNSGMFTAMVEGGDVMGIFCGHDHDNDYSVMWHNVLLAYGRYSGGNTVYNHLPCGARVIILKEGTRSFDTYIREGNGKVLNASTYPDSYISDDWESR